MSSALLTRQTTTVTRMTTRMVLVPGFWLGAWAWNEVILSLIHI